MSPLAIDLEHVWKQYPLKRDRLGFKEFMVNIHKYIGRNAEKNNHFYALKDVTIKIEKGECIGIVGRNGAGKTTLLSLMLGTIFPSRGKVKITDRVTPLLELGGGFHPDLTGRENAILNGVLLGLTKEDVLRKMASIIDFSEIGEFFNLPVRTYSSGMFLRLAFSVAIHTNPKIFIIDEVLSVGDEAFQRKSNEAMLKLIKSGVTTVLVSHNLQAIEEICSRVIWLDRGQIRAEGKVKGIIESYRKGMTDPCRL
jgi:ABC-type polysaccharide/polyol phosphate transport system ATPase subunit